MLFDALWVDAWFRILVSIVTTAILAYEDHQTSFMNEKILYAFAVSGLVWNALFLPQSIFVAAFFVAALIGAVGYVSYRAGQFGGGDVLLLAGLALWVPFSPLVALSVPWPFVVSVFLTASVFASIGASVWYGSILLRKKKFPGKKGPWFFVVSAAVLAGLALLPFGFLASLFFAALFLSAWFYFLYRKDILDHAVVEETLFKHILDEDVLALEKLNAVDVKRFSLERVLTEKARVKLKKFMIFSKRKTVPIHRHLPRFGPYLLAGLLLSLVVGDAVYWLFTNSL